MLHSTESVKVFRLVCNVKHLDNLKSIHTFIDSIYNLILYYFDKFFWETVSLIVEVAKYASQKFLNARLNHSLCICNGEGVPIREIVNKEFVDVGYLHLQAYTNFKVNNLRFYRHRNKFGVTLLINFRTKEQLEDSSADKSDINSTIGSYFLDVIFYAFFSFFANLSLFFFFRSCQKTPYTASGMTGFLQDAFCFFVLFFLLVGFFFGFFFYLLVCKLIISA